MRKPTIRKHLKDVIDEWGRKFHFLRGQKEESLEPKDFVNIVQNHSFIAGGAIASLVRDEEEQVNDYDIYIDDTDKLETLTKYYVKRFEDRNNLDYELDTKRVGSEVKVVFKDTQAPTECLVDNTQKSLSNTPTFVKTPARINSKRFIPIALTPNAITLQGRHDITIQLVTRFSGYPENVVDSFDFMHTQNYFYQNKVHFNKDAMEALLTNELIYTGSKFPLCALIRTRKFINRGYDITAGTYLQMAMDLSDVDMNSTRALREQMTGVDIVYFEEVIKKISKESGDGRISGRQVKEIIDALREEGLTLD